MVANITTILQRFTGEWAMLLEADAILTVCREIGYSAWRDRVLTPVTTILWVPKTHHHEKPASCRPCHHAARRS
jgi:hypothetical protein